MRAFQVCLFILFPIIPRPLSCSEKPGQFEFRPETVVFAANALQSEGAYFAQQFAAATGLPIKMELTAPAAPRHAIHLELADDCQHRGADG